MVDFTMPSLGADMDAGTLVEWLVREGDEVRRGDPVAVVDTDKSAIEVESFDDGVVETLLVEPGTRVAVGTPLARLRGAAEGAAASAPPVTLARPSAEPGQAPVQVHRPTASPPVRHHAAELGVDLTHVRGTGRHGGVTRADVDRAAAEREAPEREASERETGPEAAPASVPVQRAPASAGESDKSSRRASPYARRLARELGVDLARVSPRGPDGLTIHAADVRAAALPRTPDVARPVPPAPPATGPSTAAAPLPGRAPQPGRAPAHAAGRATIAALMGRSKREIPHYYVGATVDMFPVVDWLRRTNRDREVAGRIVPAAALLRATALALREHPELNGFWTGEHFVPGGGVHLGVAISVRGGALVAPAIHEADTLALPTLMDALRDVVTRARAGRLRRAEMADPTFTVSDLGDQGVEQVTGVIFPPQVALLGVGRIVERPWAVDGLLGVRPVVHLTLSGDHRATDGYTGARFLATVDRLLQHPEEL